MRIRIITLFPEMFDGPFGASIVSRATRDGLVEITTHQLRDYAKDKHRTVDDTPYGGGAGMVMKPDTLGDAVDDLKQQAANSGEPDPRVILMSPQGRRLDQRVAGEIFTHGSLIIVCGRYEGVDERFIEACVDEEISIGDYVISGGEPAAIVLVDALTRLIPGALGSQDSAPSDSFATGLDGKLQGPVYTRPPEWDGREVPEILLSGDHARLEKWRKEQSDARTGERRPDLLNQQNEYED
ncbi:MAG: tRNA (guanosine(37)-N1)-methyltransferase TrmD [Chloroflexi bacterium]|nr:tRNA (guanosine(37)-N1)-methyltransferase TrmD [Chloroflexota bacterium]MBT4514831.1 tRNA (guanosine(37)-N1)-methyltransferase TrmD [Chloroflexota bacterium]MBT5319651.1 tRNA (guanosine(37)-N1)-methyltransferase TrmD [Chloroflexota bacterium]MBT6681918.1 tRNA (guanosine(37)-N1)-methyltransferase TrmD [Chloroflexota bacterium]